jgi:hypothetical protein
MGHQAMRKRRASAADWTWLDKSHLASHPSAPPGLLRAYVNGMYSVQVFEHRCSDSLTMTHLMVRRHDEAPIRSWPDMQRVKDEIAGRGRTAVEVYPPAGEVTDSANIYHLWVFPEGVHLPFGLGKG